MLMKEKVSYTIGLDIGTASVGWACVTNDFNLMTYRGKPAFGAHVFDSADTAEARRLKRGMRRRYNRRIKRIQMLQDLFAPLINDPGFFSIKDEKHKWRNNNQFENRTLSETLLNIGVSKKDIHEKFPTIYHLRDFLIKSNKKEDLKLIYLAIHNLVKQRGHFLLGNISWEDRSSTDFIELLQEFFEKISLENKLESKLTIDELRSIEKLMKNRKDTFNDRSKNVAKIVPAEFKEVGKLLVGLKATYSNLFTRSDNYEELKATKSSIKLSDDPDQFDFSELNDNQQEIIELAQEIFLGITLDESLGNSNYIAESKVKDFNENKKQLKLLKEYINKGFGQEKYHEFFVTKREVFKEYNNLPNSQNLKKLSYFDQYRLNKNVGKDTFQKELKKVLNRKFQDDSLVKMQEKIQKEYDKDNFLSFLNNVSNASIPYQNSLYEARNILLNQKKFHTEITDELIDNVITLISFRIPYFVGPLAKDLEKSKFAWSKRYEDTNVTPFNFDQVIDRAGSAEAFIRRMTNKCTYLMEEDVLPKHSLLYQEMELLNELNGVNLRTDIDKPGRQFRIPIELRHKLIDYHFKFNKKVSHDNLKEAIFKHDSAYSTKNVYGTQKEKEFASSLSSYNDFREILGQKKLDENITAIEHIIFWLTVFNEKSIIQERIEDNFDFINEDELEKILKLNYKGWGRISEKALTMDSQGESIIDLMRNNDYVFMEALTSEKHDFQEEFKKINQKNMSEKKITYNDIEEMKSSPALRKSIWSSIKIVEELVKIFGEPENIVIEFAREEGEKKRTVEWSQFWDCLVKDNDLKSQDELTSMFKVLKEFGEDNLDYKLEKLKLYLLQGGKCLYTLENINLRSLLSENNKDYHIDHILPRNFVNDDSFNNKALVTGRANSLKSGDKMPFKLIKERSNFIQIKKYWDRLLELGMMNSSKYYRLMKEEFDDQDKERFIARQLVETRQIAVHLKTLLEERFNSKENTVNIQPLKARVVSEVRNKLDFPKIRNLNDHHHAVDALLVATAYSFGEYIKPGMFKFDLRKHKAHQKWKNLQGENTGTNNFKSELFLVSKMKKDILPSGETLQDTLEDIISNRIPIVTKKTGGSEGAFYNESILSPKVKSPQYKSEKTERFVHDSLNPKFSIYLEYLVDSKKKRLIMDVLNIEYEQYKNDYSALPIGLAKKIEPDKNVRSAKILLILEKNDLLYIDGEPYYFTSSKSQINAKQLIIPMELQRNIRRIIRDSYNYNQEEAFRIYKDLAQHVCDQFTHVFPEKGRELKMEAVTNYFEKNTKGTHKEFKETIDNLLSVSSPSPLRWEKQGALGRIRKSIGRVNGDIKISYNSITGLNHKKPKLIRKFAEY